MNIKIVFNGAGISNASMENWQRTYGKYDRIHMPLEGRAIYHGLKKDSVLHDGMAYLLINSYAPNLELLPNDNYNHMYIDFRTIPPIINSETLEIDLSEDYFSLHILRAIQMMIHENIRDNHHSTIVLQHDEEMCQQLKKLLEVMLTHWHKKYNLNTTDNPQIESAIRYIDEHYAENIRNSDIAAALYIDKRSLMRLFSKYVGMSPYQYLTQCRVEHALEKLIQGKNVTETAYLCGYRSENAFRSAFKRIMGVSPKSVMKL